MIKINKSIKNIIIFLSLMQILYVFTLLKIPLLESATLSSQIQSKSIQLQELNYILDNNKNILNHISVISQELITYRNMLPNDTGLIIQTTNIINQLNDYDIQNINPLNSNSLNDNIILREYEIKFTGNELTGIDIVKTLREIYPLTNISYISWDLNNETKMIIKVYTNDSNIS